jgi:PhnB protein
MLMCPYLSFKGDCEAAFTFYAQILGGELGEMHRYGGSPMESDAPAEWADKIMHGSVTIGGQVLMGADVAQGYEAPTGFSMSLHLKGAADAQRIFGELAKGGAVLMPLEKTFWAECFGVVTDRFGIKWSINCEA